MAFQTQLIDDRNTWDALTGELAAHPLQAWQWGELKTHGGLWTSHHVAVADGDACVGGAQILVRSMPLPFKAIAYAPRGPFSRTPEQLAAVADALAEWCKAETDAVCLRIEPELKVLELSDGWQKTETILLDKTAVIDLTPDEDEIMAHIPSRKARQYIRKAERDGVSVRPAQAADLDTILAIYHDTAEADGFGLHEDTYYREAFSALDGIQQLFVAEQEGAIQAFLWNVVTPRSTCFELWGAVNDAGKKSRANYFLKWTAIKAARDAGAVLYDMNGLLNDGISDFKLLFSNEETYWVGTYDKPLKSTYGLMSAALKLRSKLRH